MNIEKIADSLIKDAKEEEGVALDREHLIKSLTQMYEIYKEREDGKK